MATQQNLSLYSNDGPVTINCAVLQDGAALSLSGITLTIYLKASQTTPDEQGIPYTTSNGLTITNSSDCLHNWVIPAGIIGGGQSMWYHATATVTSGAEVFTWAYGTVACRSV